MELYCFTEEFDSGDICLDYIVLMIALVIGNKKGSYIDRVRMTFSK